MDKEKILELRRLTQIGIGDCKMALEEANGDIEKAIKVLKKKGIEIAEKKKEEKVREGRIGSYIHFTGKIGVLLEVNCQTDFVAKNEEFCKFTKDIAMHIAASNPIYLKREDVPQSLIEEQEDKEKFYRENCLLEQPFIKDESISIGDYLNLLIAKLGENIAIRRFIRYKVGEE